MEKLQRLKISSLMLFWFGVILQGITLLFIISEYIDIGYSPYLIRGTESLSKGLALITAGYNGLIHVVHILAGYFLSKGTKKGIVIGLGISIIEILIAFTPSAQPYIGTAAWVGVRIYFIIIIYLMITGRKELQELREQNWRPWMPYMDKKYHHHGF